MRKLSPEQVEAIKIDARKNGPIAAEYGVDPSVISRIKCGKRHQPRLMVDVPDCVECGAIRRVRSSSIYALKPYCKGCAARRRWRERHGEPRSKPEILARSRAYNEKHKIKLTLHYMRQRDEMKLEMIKEYGGACRRCGTSDPDVLAIDHVHNDGASDRKGGGWGGPFFRKLKLMGWPKGRYQILCYNCNTKKELERRRQGLLDRLSALQPGGSTGAQGTS